MASVRRGQEPLKLELSSSPVGLDHPHISALFLIYFDIKAGYTIAWERSLPGVQVEGVVEYKSLPSGLHAVKEDLIYFVHDNHAGLSAFVNAPAAEEARNARMIAVGLMVPLGGRRFGSSWKHAEQLKEMASELVVDTTKRRILEDYWAKHKAEGSYLQSDIDDQLYQHSGVNKDPKITPSGRMDGQASTSSGSDRIAALLLPAHSLSSYHPVWSLVKLLQSFGPLIFPIYRAALLRKRILIIAPAPVRETCDYVYDIVVLSDIPLAVSDLLAPVQSHRLRPLFSIGVHDIPLLEDLRIAKAASAATDVKRDEHGNAPGIGWIACTSDTILATKSTLYDVLITIPPRFSEHATEKVWPKIESPQGVELRATQRDLRRYHVLHRELFQHAKIPPSPATVRSNRVAEDDQLPPAASFPSLLGRDSMFGVPETDAVVEPLSWSALAYSGFMWWASAGERRLPSDDESEADHALLSGLSLSTSPPITPRAHSQSQSIPSYDISSRMEESTPAHQQMAIIAYFHRLTAQILTTLGDIVDTTDSDDEREDEAAEEGLNDVGDAADAGPAVYISGADVTKMGLDMWSDADHQFLDDMTRRNFGRRAHVEKSSVDVCGIRIC